MDFWKAAAVRAVRTMAEVALAMLPVTAKVSEVSWLTVASTCVYAGILSLLAAVATGLPETDGEPPRHIGGA